MKVVKFFLRNLKAILFSLLVFANGTSFGQGLINNGAFITITGGAFIYVDGGLSTGNFTNQDAGAFTGTINNSGTIDVTGDWINNSASNVFNANTGTVELLGGNNQAITGSTATYFNNLSLSGTGTKRLNIRALTGGGFAAPAGILALNDRPLDLNTNTLEVNNPATSAITRTSGYVISETNSGTNTSIVKWNVGASNGAYVFPFGISAGTYIPFTVTKSAGNTSISVSTRTTGANDNLPWETTVTNMFSPVIGGNGAIPVVIDRWWDVYSPSSFTASASFTYIGSENTTTYSPSGTFAAQNWLGGFWFAPVGSGPGVTAGTAVVSIPSQVLGGTIATPWILANIIAPLPVELLSFEAYLKSSKVDITWSTASEINSDYFIVEKSTTGYDFTEVGSKPAAGNSTGLLNYGLTDDSPFNGLSYYRLKQVDKDASFRYSHSVAVYTGKESQFDFINVFVNKGGIATLMFANNKTEICRITVFDMLGKELYTEQIQSAPGFNNHEINMENFSHGIYYVSISNSGKSSTKKVIY